ncbi:MULTISPECIES: ATP-binding cassette domain-containing protein [Staphylococcus]|uniref:ATP-binding cassette domain-containing protein n=1 Tax=Staphylococcus TaxID=1279 RepID=UPI001C829C50|nr:MULTISPECIES: ABC transporter ATP-binding protein [Staphylococcus]MBX5317032.1 ABC transporter ATP-binding protein [Staphylococcus caprae]MBX5324338.1 ABC transporter ATP-binding protein [Staphylococcus caprae]MDS3852924.1 ABC transporter ATP-binding protein [Staphylococcus hominis]
MIKLKNIFFNFGNNNILSDINLNIEQENKIIGLLGPNGAGKTTLFNILTNYYQKYHGEINNDEFTYFLLPDKEYIPGNLTINTCLKDFQKLYTNFNKDRALKLLNKLNLDFNKKIADFSKGMKEQLHLIFSLAQDVDLYVFDEPLAAVDPVTRDILIELIKNGRKENSVAIISTHLVQDMDELFDEVIIINHGKIVLHEKTELLTNQYNDTLNNIYKESAKNADTY